MRRSRIPIPDEMPKDYLVAYWSNWYAKIKRRKPRYDWIAECAGCGVEGILGRQLIHRGLTRPTNLFCDSCFGETGGPDVIKGIDNIKGKGGSASRSVRVQSRKPKVV